IPATLLAHRSERSPPDPYRPDASRRDPRPPSSLLGSCECEPLDQDCTRFASATASSVINSPLPRNKPASEARRAEAKERLRWATIHERCGAPLFPLLDEYESWDT